MNGVLLFILLFLLGILSAVVGAIMFMAVFDRISKNKQHKQFYNFYEATGVLFATLIYCMSDSLGKKTVINYITNAIKIGINKDLLEFTDDTQINDCAESIYESVIEAIEREDD